MTFVDKSWIRPFFWTGTKHLRVCSETHPPPKFPALVYSNVLYFRGFRSPWLLMFSLCPCVIFTAESQHSRTPNCLALNSKRQRQDRMHRLLIIHHSFYGQRQCAYNHRSHCLSSSPSSSPLPLTSVPPYEQCLIKNNKHTVVISPISVEVKRVAWKKFCWRFEQQLC